ncbi:bifunctional hydroxymethylpyrimidine kinase/phosphomethylpyrimidine kinase [Pseudanabaena sp. PCC 6802]|uniref:bifunctional hydroxymethylpyrimidine kinase/phosphomethylpyrimidine kinase n=1 Tax=Pseudanabaena sp. PCC 6802 TaxID=118173 RepID=UPI0003773675|nr:bifunctional hydroxymethylpyrimidine kinase/phosphomethylpyrimidine kinase [Pseudanabaena sp. PCC 6802]
MPTNILDRTNVPVAMTIAGSDSGGGAGIQADLRTFAFHCVHGTSAITCVTAQNTLGVNRVDAMSPEAVAAQIEAVVTDIRVLAVKTGMLLNQEIIRTIAKKLAAMGFANVVVDPVMVSRTGAQLIDDDAVQSMTRLLLPLAAIATPNRYEAQILAGMEIATLADMQQAAQKILSLGVKTLLVKGGGMPGELRGVDVWCEDGQIEVLRTETVETPHTHGTGCTLSAAIAANLALGKPKLIAVKDAKTYVTQALKHSLAIGKGQGPVGHFFPLLSAPPGLI